MPRAARFKIVAVEELLRQLEYAPPETRRRQMDAAERLIDDIDPHQNYPEDFIVFRITGYRPDRADEPVTFVGEALLPDLINLVQTLSEKLELQSEDQERRALTMEMVAQRLNISQKTIQRYRKQGLVCHYVVFADDEKRLACFEDALDRFVSGHRKQLDRAGSFSRVDSVLQAAMVDEARQIRQNERLSLNETALRLAQRHGRAHETIRMMLRRHDRRAAQRIFSEHGPLTERDGRLIFRAWQRGIEPAEIARRVSKSKPTIHRAVNRQRRVLLSDIKVNFIHLPTFDRPDAAAVILAAPAVMRDLNQSFTGSDNALTLVDALHHAEPVPRDAEEAMIAGYNFVKMRAAQSMAKLDAEPNSETLDAIETDLRWAALLQRKLVMLSLPAALGQIEQNLHRSLASQSVENIIHYLRIAMETAKECVDSIDPSRGQRLDRLTAFAMDRALAKLAEPIHAHRAAARHAAGAVRIPEVWARLNPWEAWINPRPDLRRHLDAIDERSRRVMEERFGFSGGAPMTIADTARTLNMKPVVVVRILQRALRTLRAQARSAT